MVLFAAFGHEVGIVMHKTGYFACLVGVFQSLSRVARAYCGNLLQSCKNPLHLFWMFAKLSCQATDRSDTLDPQ